MSKLPPELRKRLDDYLATAVEQMLAPLAGKDLKRALAALAAWRETGPIGTGADLIEQARAAIAKATGAAR